MRRLQFSLRMMLAAVAVVGIGAGLWVAKPSWQLGVVEVLLSAWLLASVATLAAQRSGLAKAWWMGVLAECCLAEFGLFHFAIEQEIWYGSVGGFQILAHLISDRFQFLLAAWAFAPVVGLLCILTHWLLVRPPQSPKD